MLKRALLGFNVLCLGLMTIFEALLVLTFSHSQPISEVQFELAKGGHIAIVQPPYLLVCMELGSGRFWVRCVLAGSQAGRGAVPSLGDSMCSLSQSHRGIR